VGRAAHHVGLVGRKEHNSGRNRLGLDPWNAKRRLCAESRFRFGFQNSGRLHGIEIVNGLCIPLPVSSERRVNEAGIDGVHRDLVYAELERRRFHEADDAPFGGGIGGAELGAVPSLLG
jgi:hypothetical protein